MLFNNGPTSLGFVIILEEGGVAQEIKEGDDKTLPRSLSSCITASPNQVTFHKFTVLVRRCNLCLWKLNTQTT